MGWTSGPPILEDQHRMRANLEAGARPRFRRRTKVAAVLTFVVLLVGSCASFAWIFFAQYLGIEQQIVQDSNGAIVTLVIGGPPGGALVQVQLARGTGEARAREVVCSIVVPELAAVGIHPGQIQVIASEIVLSGTSAQLCSVPPPTIPPSPAPNSG